MSFAQLGVGDHRGEVVECLLRALGLAAGAEASALEAGLTQLVDRATRLFEGLGVLLEGVELLGRELDLLAREDVVRRTLEHLEVAGLLRDLGHVLHRRRGRAHRDHALAAKVEVVTPLRGVELLAREVLLAGPRRRLRRVELPPRRNEEVGGVLAAVTQGEVPVRLRLDPLGLHNLGTVEQVRFEPERVAQRLLVAEHLALAREHLRHTGEREVRVVVHVCLGVARRARVGVVAPHAANAVGLLEDREVVVAIALELGGHAEAAEARAENGDAEVLDGHGGVSFRMRGSARSTCPRSSEGV